MQAITTSQLWEGGSAKSEGRGQGRDKGKLGMNELGERCRGGVCHLGQEWRGLGQGRG